MFEGLEIGRLGEVLHIQRKREGLVESDTLGGLWWFFHAR